VTFAWGESFCGPSPQKRFCVSFPRTWVQSPRLQAFAEKNRPYAWNVCNKLGRNITLSRYLTKRRKRSQAAQKGYPGRDPVIYRQANKGKPPRTGSGQRTSLWERTQRAPPQTYTFDHCFKTRNPPIRSTSLGIWEGG